MRKFLVLLFIFYCVLNLAASELPSELNNSNVFCFNGFPLYCTLSELDAALKAEIKGDITWELPQPNQLVLRVKVKDLLTNSQKEDAYLFETTMEKSLIVRAVINGYELNQMEIISIVANTIAPLVQSYKIKKSGQHKPDL